MNAIPQITVQLVHIEGPLKGRIQELQDHEITIGRHPDCQVCYPRDEVILSRRHARILREGNRFRLIDQSTNGTFVNGKLVAEAYLQSGDVLTFADGGPKLSFLTHTHDSSIRPKLPHTRQTSAASMPSPQPADPAPDEPSPAEPLQHVEPNPAAPIQAAEPSPPAPPKVQTSAEPVVEITQVPFVIQYGAALKSFQTLPITLGKGADCHFLIQHPALNDNQAQIFFAQDQYWIKDLSGNKMIRIDGLPIVGQCALQPDMEIALSPKGPKFRFLGSGRLAEVEDEGQEKAVAEALPDNSPENAERNSQSPKAGPGEFFKKLFK